MERKKFIAAVLNPNEEIFVVYVAAPSLDLEIYLIHRAQLAVFFAGNAHIVIFFKYADFADVFTSEFVVKLLKYIRINNYLIDLVNGQQLFYKLIWNLEPVQLEILKTYIKINVANGFIRASILPI